MSLFLQYGATDVAPKGLQLGYAHSHPGKTVDLAVLFWSISFLGHTQLLNSTNCWLITLFQQCLGTQIALKTDPITFGLL